MGIPAWISFDREFSYTGPFEFSCGRNHPLRSAEQVETSGSLGYNWVQELAKLAFSDFLSRCRKKVSSEKAVKKAPAEEAGSASTAPEADPDAAFEGDEDGVPRLQLGSSWAGSGRPTCV